MGFLSVIRRWALRDKMPIREIARRTGLSRNTIRKYLRAEIVEPSFRTPTRPSKLDPFAEKPSGWLVMEVRKSRKDRRTAKQMHADLVKLGFDGSYERVAAIVRARKADRQRAQQTTGRGTFVPLVFQPGEAFQFDWSEDWAVRIGAVFDMTGNKVRLDLGVIDLLVDGFVDSNRRKQAPIVPVTGPMNRILKRLMGQHQEDHLIRSGGEPMSEGARNWTQIIQRLVVRGGAGRTPDQVKRKLLEPTDQGNVNWYSIRRTFADWLDERVSDAAISAVMGHFEISSRTRRQLFEAGSPTTDLYKRRMLGPVMEVGEALERVQRQPPCPAATTTLAGL